MILVFADRFLVVIVFVCLLHFFAVVVVVSFCYVCFVLLL